MLSWLIEGARKVIAVNYQINRPQCVLDAIGSYREGNDWLGNFINECCEVDKSYQAKSGDLYQRYRDFCNENGNTQEVLLIFMLHWNRPDINARG